MDEFEISLLICTRNRADKLGHALGSVVAAMQPVATRKIEVVLVDNGSTDRTQDVIREWAASVPFPVSSIIESRPGLSAARNAGIRVAKGRLIAFTDDDCSLNIDYFSIILKLYENRTDITIRGGRVELGDPTDVPYTILLGEVRQRLQEGILPAGFVIGANLVIPADIFRRVGMFDERFGAGAKFKAAEESDLIYRAHRLGFQVEYVPELIVQHFHGRKEKSEVTKLSRGYMMGNGAMYGKHIKDDAIQRHIYWDLKRRCTAS
jgi:glycosyltransferase involved in cell wall biosynthesis